MTSLADTLRTSAIPERIVAAWNAVATRWNPLALIVVAWAALTMPLVFFRGYNSDDGLAVSIARTALEDGEWVVPHMFNLRKVERPTLLSWIIAAISAPFSSVSQITARLPVVLFLLFGCLLIYALLRKVAASVPAALFGVALFLACPVMITADLPLAVLLFFAFFLWWGGNERGSISFGRWLAIGFVLALAGLLKGPQPIAYFALGIGLYVLATRSWRQIPGLVMAGLICAIPLAAWYAAVHIPGDETIWAAFMRVRPWAQFPGPLTASFRTLTETLSGTRGRRVSDRAGVSRQRLRPPGLRRCARLFRLRGAAVHPLLAGRLHTALLYADGVAAVCVRRPRLRPARRAAAADRGADPGPDRLLPHLRFGHIGRIAVLADAVSARANAGHAHGRAGASHAGADLPDRRHRAQRAALRTGANSRHRAGRFCGDLGSGVAGRAGRSSRSLARAAAGATPLGHAARRKAAMAAASPRPVNCRAGRHFALRFFPGMARPAHWPRSGVLTMFDESMIPKSGFRFSEKIMLKVCMIPKKR
jgi:hypothetical protein